MDSDATTSHNRAQRNTNHTSAVSNSKHYVTHVICEICDVIVKHLPFDGAAIVLFKNSESYSSAAGMIDKNRFVEFMVEVNNAESRWFISEIMAYFENPDSTSMTALNIKKYEISMNEHSFIFINDIGQFRKDTNIPFNNNIYKYNAKLASVMCLPVRFLDTEENQVKGLFILNNMSLSCSDPRLIYSGLYTTIQHLHSMSISLGQVISAPPTAETYNPDTSSKVGTICANLAKAGIDNKGSLVLAVSFSAIGFVLGVFAILGFSQITIPVIGVWVGFVTSICIIYESTKGYRDIFSRLCFFIAGFVLLYEVMVLFTNMISYIGR